MSWDRCAADQQRRRIDLTSIDAPACQFILGQSARADIQIAVWDLTSDIGIPVFGCVIADLHEVRSAGLPPAGGYGCHPNREIALLRALTEAAQSRLTAISGARDDLHTDDYRLDAEARAEILEIWNEPTSRLFHTVKSPVSYTHLTLPTIQPV